jgi:hypothetical protein
MAFTDFKLATLEMMPPKCEYRLASSAFYSSWNQCCSDLGAWEEEEEEEDYAR